MEDFFYVGSFPYPEPHGNGNVLAHEWGGRVNESFTTNLRGHNSNQSTLPTAEVEARQTRHGSAPTSPSFPP